MASYFGSSLKVQIFGQSHSPAIGVVLDGLPAGEYIDFGQLASFMKRRSPTEDAWSTPRREADAPDVLSGLNSEGRTCGAPLALTIANTGAHRHDYDDLAFTPRPGHADLSAYARWHGQQDASGGGHFSGRLTAALCAAGGIALQILSERRIEVGAHIASIGDVKDSLFDPVDVCSADLSSVRSKRFSVISDEAGCAMQDLIAQVRRAGDSVGGVIECACVGLPAGVGSPIFGGLESRLAQVLFGIPAVKGLEFGSGFAGSELLGSSNNDPYEMTASGAVCATTNNAGGILGGISTGMPLVFRVACKPTPSISVLQKSVDLRSASSVDLVIEGRHDSCIVVRAVPVVEAACALALLDALLDDGFINPVCRNQA